MAVVPKASPGANKDNRKNRSNNTGGGSGAKKVGTGGVKKSWTKKPDTVSKPGFKKAFAGKDSVGVKRKREEGASGGGNEEPRIKQRQLKKERQMQKPENEVVVRAKEIWNRLRERKVPPAERTALVKELVSLLKGKVYKIIMRHDASRVVQCAVQFATPSDRSEILSELEGHLVELSQLQYAHFIVLKLLTHAREASERKRILKALRGSIPKLAVHSIGARVIEAAMQALPAAQAATVRAELYGPEYALFADAAESSAPRHLKDALELRPDRRQVIMAGVKKMIIKLVEKGLMTFSYAHDLLWDYMEAATPAERVEIVPQIVDSCMALISTRSGSKAAAMCAAYGAAKDRKRILKGFKGFVASSLMHRDAYLAVLRLLASVDDTVASQKMILNELLEPVPAAPAPSTAAAGTAVNKGTSAEEWVPRGLAKSSGTGESVEDAAQDMDVDQEANDEEEGADELDEEGDVKSGGTPTPKHQEIALVPVCLHTNGCKVILYLLKGESEDGHYLDPEELKVLAPAMVPKPGTDEMMPTSRKESSVRRSELLSFLKAPLLKVCEDFTDRLMRSKFAGSKVLLEVVKLHGNQSLVDSIVAAAMAPPQDGATPMHEDPSGHLFMKQLLLWEAAEQKEGRDGVGFADSLFKSLKPKSGLLTWAQVSRGGFVLSALAAVPSVAADVAAALKGGKAQLAELAEKGNKGAEALTTALAAASTLEKPAPKNTKTKDKPSSIQPMDTSAIVEEVTEASQVTKDAAKGKQAKPAGGIVIAAKRPGRAAKSGASK